MTHEDGDLRKELFPDTTYNDEAGLSPNGVTVYDYNAYWPMKYAGEQGTMWGSTSNMQFLRMSDISLLLAEAYGRRDRISVGYPLIDFIRTRAGLTPLTPGMNKDEFDDAVWQERLWELALEGHTMTDLRRKRIVEEFVGLDNMTYQYFYPIPQREVDLNNSINADPDKITAK